MQLSKLLKPIDEEEDDEDSPYLCVNCERLFVLVFSSDFVCGILGCVRGSSVTGEITGFGFLATGIVTGDFFMVSVGEAGGLASLSSIALERGKNGVFPKNVLDFDGVLFLSWNAGGGDMIGVIEGGENDSGIGLGEGVLVLVSKSRD